MGRVPARPFLLEGEIDGIDALSFQPIKKAGAHSLSLCSLAERPVGGDAQTAMRALVS